MQRLFSYGTLRLPSVQIEHFGRLLVGTEDRLPGYRVFPLRITDSAVIAASGADVHPILRASPEASDVVEGTVFELSDKELAAADRYEVGDYVRVLVRLESGLPAWVYAEAAAPGDTAGPGSGRDTGVTGSEKRVERIVVVGDSIA